MRSTNILLGIKGIFPLIKKECPNSIYYPPNRFSSLSGYRIAIDATLLVQRFHFSDDEHPARHVVGFHRLIASLRAANVYPIFVFDHLTSRISAKARETEKRKEAKSKLKARRAVEVRRAWRLKMLDITVKQIKELSQEEREIVTGLSKSWKESRSEEVGGPEPAGLQGNADVDPIDSPAIEEWSHFRMQLDQLGSAVEQKLQHTVEATVEDTPIPQIIEDQLTSDSDKESEEWYQTLRTEVQEEVEQWHTIYADQTSSAYALAARMDDLRRGFSRTPQSQEGSGANEPPQRTPTQVKMDEVEEKVYDRLAEGAHVFDLEDPADLTWKMVESKVDDSIREAQQADLALEESTKAGEDEVEDSTTVTHPISSLDLLQELSRTLRRSYARFTSPLAPNVFDDCATLCSLLQVPVLWTGSGSPHGGAKGEAEALAASLVTIGEADAVATEDSDVLLAEVPLIRHLTGTKKPLQIVDSRAARVALFPLRVDTASSARKVRPAKNDGTDTDTIVEDPDPEMDRLAALSRADRLSRYAMLEFALLCGTDYNRTIPGLGPVGALKLLKEHQTIRGILKSGGASSKYTAPKGMDWKEYGAELSRARYIFRNPPDALRALRMAGIKTSGDEATEVEEESSSPEEEGKPVPTLQLPPRPAISLIDSLKREAESSLQGEGESSLQGEGESSLQGEGESSLQGEGESSLQGEGEFSLQGEGESNVQGESQRLIFEVPKFDRHAVRSFLRSKGLGKGRIASTSTSGMEHKFPGFTSSYLDAEESMMPFFDPKGSEEDNVGRSSSSPSFVDSQELSQGFGPALGGEVAVAHFGFDQDGTFRQERRSSVNL